MDFRVGIVITSLLLGTVQPDACTSFTDLSEPCGCTLSPETFEPTCGSDGHTYLNLCFLECRKAIDMVDISIDYIGICMKESRCTCHAGYAPICGTNGVTYSNKCLFDCFMKKDRKIRLKHVGECDSVDEQRYCITNYHNCYRNILPQQWNNQPCDGGLTDESKKQHLDKPGACRCRSELRSYYTRFGDNGQRYARSSCGCRAKKQKPVQKVQPASEPMCPSSNNQKKNANSRSNEDVLPNTTAGCKPCVCAAMHKPVCGTNRRTYANFCVLYCSSKKDPSVQLRRWGDCSN